MWLGNISYAFYLIQFPVMVAVTRFVVGGRQFGFFGWLGCAALCLFAGVLCAALLYHWVDLSLMRRFAGRDHSTSPQPDDAQPKLVSAGFVAESDR